MATRNDPAEWVPFRPYVYVVELFRNRELFPEINALAVHLAKDMAASCSRTTEGEYLVWRGTDSLAAGMRVVERSVRSARAELESVGLFEEHYHDYKQGLEIEIELEDGTVKSEWSKAGIRVMRLVVRTQEEWAWLARSRAKATVLRSLEALRARHQAGELTSEEYKAEEDKTLREAGTIFM